MGWFHRNEIMESGSRVIPNRISWTPLLNIQWGGGAGWEGSLKWTTKEVQGPKPRYRSDKITYFTYTQIVLHTFKKHSRASTLQRQSNVHLPVPSSCLGHRLEVQREGWTQVQNGHLELCFVCDGQHPLDGTSWVDFQTCNNHHGFCPELNLYMYM